MTSTTSATATTVHDPSPTTTIDLQSIVDRPWLVALTANVVQRWSPCTRRQLAYALARLLLVALDHDRARDLLVGIYLARGGRARAAAEQHYKHVVEQAEIDRNVGEHLVETDEGHMLCRPLSPYDALARLGIDARRIIAESQAPRWRALTIAELEATAAATAHDRWVVEQLVPAGEVTVIGGAPKARKSWLALYSIVCVAAGIPVLGEYTVRQGPVLVIAEDDGVPEIEHRLRAITRGLGVDRYALPIRVVVRQRVRIDQQGSIAWIREQIASSGARIVLIDSLSRVHSAEESSRSEMAPLLDGLLYLAEGTRAAVMLVHHARKGGTDGGSPSAALRGSSDLAAVARSVLLIDRDARDRMVLDVDANYAIPGQLVIDAVLPRHDDPEPVAKFAIVRGAVAVPAARSRSRGRNGGVGDLATQIVNLIAQRGPVARKYLVRALGVRDADVYSTVTEMITAGLLREVPMTGTREDGRQYAYSALGLPGADAAAASTDARTT